MKILLLIITLVIWFALMVVAGYFDTTNAGYYESCVPEKMVERQFGFDVPLSSLEYAPSDHIVYTRSVCGRVPLPKIKHNGSFINYIQTIFSGLSN